MFLQTNIVHTASFNLYWWATGRNEGSGNVAVSKFKSCTHRQSRTCCPIWRSLLSFRKGLLEQCTQQLCSPATFFKSFEFEIIISKDVFYLIMWPCHYLCFLPSWFSPFSHKTTPWYFSVVWCWPFFSIQALAPYNKTLQINIFMDFVISDNKKLL